MDYTYKNLSFWVGNLVFQEERKTVSSCVKLNGHVSNTTATYVYLPILTALSSTAGDW